MPLNMGMYKSFLRETGFEVKEASQRAPEAWPCESPREALAKVQPSYSGDTGVSWDASAVGQLQGGQHMYSGSDLSLQDKLCVLGMTKPEMWTCSNPAA